MGARWRGTGSGLMATGIDQAECDEGRKMVYERIRMRDVATDISIELNDTL